MSGLENLIQNKHLDPKNPSKLIPSKYGSYGHLNCRRHHISYLEQLS